MELVDAEGAGDSVKLMRGIDLGYGPHWRVSARFVVRGSAY